jgi:transposase
MSYTLNRRVQMRPSGSPKFLERRRLRAILLLQNGLQPVDIARQIGIDRRSVRRWKVAFLKDGLVAIRARPLPGPPDPCRDTPELA